MVAIQTSTGVVTLPEGVTITSKSSRFLCALLEGVLAIVTLGIGYFIWSFFTYRHGQTPGKKLMGIRVISLETGKALPFWMTLLREWIVKSFLGSITLGIAYAWVLFDDKNQALYDKVMTTVVVNDAAGVTVPPPNSQNVTSF